MDAPIPQRDARIEELIRASAEIGLMDSAIISALIKVGHVDEASCGAVSRFDSAF